MRFEGETYDDGRTIELDGNEFVRCIFEHCVLRYCGGPMPVLHLCSFRKAARWLFEGSAAETLRFMGQLYQAGARQLIEATFENMRGRASTGGLLPREAIT